MVGRLARPLTPPPTPPLPLYHHHSSYSAINAIHMPRLKFPSRPPRRSISRNCFLLAGLALPARSSFAIADLTEASQTTYWLRPATHCRCRYI